MSHNSYVLIAERDASQNSCKFVQLKVDMGALHTVCVIATQGKKNGSFVKSYKLSFSTDESSWIVYQEQNIDKVWNNSTLISSSKNTHLTNAVKPVGTA